MGSCCCKNKENHMIEEFSLEKTDEELKNDMIKRGIETQEQTINYKIKYSDLLSEKTNMKNFNKRYQKISDKNQEEIEAGFGKLSIQKDTVLDKEVIVKQLKSVTSENNQQFKQEIELVKTFDYPNIIKIQDIQNEQKCCIQPKLYVVFEQIKSKYDLFDYVKQNEHVDEETISHLLSDSLQALQYIHNQGYIHRDIKPENIMVVFNDDDQQKSAKLIDFGSCIKINNTQTTNTCQGTTTNQLAPECFKGYFSTASDIWALGVVAQFMSQRVKLFGSKRQAKREEIEDQIKHYRENDLDFTRNQNTSEELKELIQAMLRINKNERCEAKHQLTMNFFKNNQRRYSIESRNYKKEKELTEIITNKIMAYNVINTIYQRVVSTNKIVEKMISNKTNMIIQKVAGTFMTNQIIDKQDKEYNEIENIFKLQDKNMVGELRESELSELLKASKYRDENVSSLLHKIDLNRDGKISWSEFKQVLVVSDLLSNNDVIKKTFSSIDLYGTGKIDRKNINEQFGKYLGEDVWNRMLKQVDINNKGYIGKKEFQNAMKLIVDASYNKY